MAYVNVTNVADMNAVLGNIATFLIADSWTMTANMGAPSVDGPPFVPITQLVVPAGGHVVIARKNDCLVTLRSTTSGLGSDCLYLLGAYGAYTSGSDGTLPTNDGLNTSNLYIGGPGSPLTNAGGIPGLRGFQQTVGPFPNLYLFSDSAGTYVHIVLEIFAGVYRHMHFGNLTKFGTWTGGAYFAGMFWNQSNSNPFPISNPADSTHSVPFDNQQNSQSNAWTVHYQNASDKWIYNGSDQVFGGVQRREARGSARGGFPNMFKNIQESLFSALIPLGPVIIGAVRESDVPITTRWIGQVPDFRLINIQNLLPAQEFSIGADTWKVFPMCSKNTVPTQNGSKVAGFAYKKIV